MFALTLNITIMKKTITLLTLLASFAMNAQYFKVTPQGLKDTNEDKTYVVLEFPNQTKEAIYTKSIKYIHQSFKNPEHVIKSDLKNESIRYISYKPNGMKVNNSGAKIQVDIKYAVQLDFKDGKVKYEIVDQDFGGFTYSGNIWKGYPIWNENNGKLRLEDEKTELENHFNTIVTDYVNYINGKTETNNDW